MARFFRSQRPRIGDRIVVRRRLPGTDGETSDVIGHVLSLDPLTVRPQRVGGLPSRAPALTIPDELIAIVRIMSPRTVRNSQIRAIESATAAAFPGLEHRWSADGQWLLRLGDGITERSNSATPLGRTAGLEPVPLEEITDFYHSHDMPVTLHIPERIAKGAETLVQGPGWLLGPEILVMARDLDNLPHPTASLTGPAAELTLRIDDQPDDDWLALYHFRGQALPADALDLLRRTIDGTMGFARLIDAAGATVAITRATITAAPDGAHWLGYSAVEVAPAWRRHGLATRLGAEVLAWGAAHGAQGAYLQAISTNTAGIGLYHKLGFLEHHRHRYATEDFSRAPRPGGSPT